jgi:spore maturation protein CgeB
LRVTAPLTSVERTVTSDRLDIVILGLSITSSWGNGHATTFRALAKALHAEGHRVTFLERDVPWYAGNRDLPAPPYCRAILYSSLAELAEAHGPLVRNADLVVIGSFVPEGIAVARWARAEARGCLAFYDIDTPATLAALERDSCNYLDRALVPAFDVYLSFTGGPTLLRLERELGARAARPLYCSVDPDNHGPAVDGGLDHQRWDLGYMGTYSADRQPAVDMLLLEPARHLPDRRFVVAGALYPDGLDWPANVERIVHVAPGVHRQFYGAQRLTLNVTRADMVRAGHSPSVRIFEAAACGTPIVSDVWPGIESFLRPGEEILLARGAEDVLRCLTLLDPDELRRIGQRGRRRVLAEHTAAHRARELLAYTCETSRPRARGHG